MSTVESEKQGVAKVQKTFYLNEALAAAVDSVADASGASFTKIVTASLLCYLLGQSDDIKKRWMREAVALETRNLSLGAIIVRALEFKIESAEESIELWKALDDDTKVQEWRERHKRLKRYIRLVHDELEGQDDLAKISQTFSSFEIA